MTILFGVQANTEQDFWDAWIAAGICSAPRVYAPGYASGIETTHSWPGVVLKDEVPVPRWHTNVRVTGELEQRFIYGLAQYNPDGTLKPVWERTHALQLFGLTYKDADPTTGYPKGYQSSNGVVYADFNDFTSPSNVWA